MKRRFYKKGEIFDDLKVIGQAPPNSGKQRVWCECKLCGNTVIRYLSGLHKETSSRRSCGCNRKIISQKKTKSYSRSVFSETMQRFYLGQFKQGAK